VNCVKITELEKNSSESDIPVKGDKFRSRPLKKWTNKINDWKSSGQIWRTRRDEFFFEKNVTNNVSGDVEQNKLT